MRIYFSNGDLTSLMGGGGKRLHTGGSSGSSSRGTGGDTGGSADSSRSNKSRN